MNNQYKRGRKEIDYKIVTSDDENFKDIKYS